jgi:hypothetical protein
MDLDEAAAEVRRLAGHREVPFSALKADPRKVPESAKGARPARKKPTRPTRAHGRLWVARCEDRRTKGTGSPGYGTVPGRRAKDL